MDTDKMKRIANNEADKAARIAADPHFRKRLTEIRHKWSIPPDGFTSVEERRQQGASTLSASDPEEKFRSDLTKLMDEFCPNPHWYWGLHSYVLFNKLEFFMPNLPGPRIRMRFDAKGQRVGVDIELDPGHTPEDIVAMWPYVKNVLRIIDYGPVKRQPYHNIQRDNEIAELKYKHNMSNKDISKHMSDKGFNVTTEYVSTILKRRKDKFDTSPAD
jgi:hypothetical protein